MYMIRHEKAQKLFAVAPMMDWTDRHCRFFHRQLTRHALLYTEMVVVDAILKGDRNKLLGYHPCEHPLALQVGGNDPRKMAEAAKIAQDWGYCEININVGCPSDRVQSGTFGACLMRNPERVGACVEAMKAATTIPVTVKCRIGVDDQDPETALDALAIAVWNAGCNGLWVHARKAWLEGLSPKQNRDIPPLNYDRVYRLKRSHPNRFIGINGGIVSLQAVRHHLENVDGVMVGRAAYHEPDLLRQVDQIFFADKNPPISYPEILDAMKAYASDHLQAGGRLNHITRHMIGLFHGQAGARKYRQILSQRSTGDHSQVESLDEAFNAVLKTMDAAA